MVKTVLRNASRPTALESETRQRDPASWSRLKRVLWEQRPFNQKLAMAVWLSVVPISLTASLIALQHARQQVQSRLGQLLIWNARQASNSLSFWDQHQLHKLEMQASDEAIQSMQPETAGNVLRIANQYFPHVSNSLIRKDGSTVAYAGQLLGALDREKMKELFKRPQSSYFQALRGVSATGLLVPPYAKETCVLSTAPVYHKGNRQKQDIAGVITACMTWEDLEFATGINDLNRSVTGERDSLPKIDLDHGKPRGYAMLLVPEKNRLVVLSGTADKKGRSKHIDSTQLATSPWAPLVRAASANKQSTSFQRVRMNGINYFAGMSRHGPEQVLAMVMDEESAFSTVHDLFKWLNVGMMLALAGSTVAIAGVCKELSRPIDIVGEALAGISQGQWVPPLPESNSDFGRLYGYVNKASNQLQQYLAETRIHAATDAQLAEARRIQAAFLIKDLPCNDQVVLAALFEPAYQIGADWYDAFQLDGLTFLIVADVCDKGIPSALFMSVFRSLIRLSIFKEWEDAKKSDATLSLALSTVNRYMADTHGDTGMFATVFVGAYDPANAELVYIVAGHEAPLILQGQLLTTLELGGPAVGIFADAAFLTRRCPLGPGGLLLAYSDGLPDARNPEGMSFGADRIAAILRERPSEEWTANALVERLHNAASAYMEDAEQFDDLTLLSLRIETKS